MYSIIKISQNTEKNPGDLKRFAIAQNSSERPSANADVKKLSIILVWFGLDLWCINHCRLC